MLTKFWQVLINLKSKKINFNCYLLLFPIFLSSFYYGGNNNTSLLVSNILLYTFFLFNIDRFNFNYFKKYKSIFTAQIIFIIYLVFQLIPNFDFVFHLFSNTHLELYEKLLGVNYRSISINPFVCFQYLILVFNFLLIFFMVPQIINSKKNLNVIFQSIIVIGLVHIIFGMFVETFGLYQKLIIYEKNFYISSLTGFFINRNNFSFFLLIIFIINFYYLGFYKKYFLAQKKTSSQFFQFISSNLFIYRLSLIFISVGIILTKSRAGNLSFLIVLCLIFLIEYFKYKKITFNLVLVTSVILLDLLILSNLLGLSGLIERVAATTIDGEASRLSVFLIGFKEFLNFPIFGYGYGGFEVLYRLNHDIYPTFYNHVHNDFIQFLGEFGIVGLSLFSFWIFRIIQNFKRNFNKNIYELNMIIILTFLITLIHGSLDFALHIPGNIYLLFFILSLSLTEIKRSIKN